MTNEERRHALNSARRRAFEHANYAEALDPDHDLTPWTKHARLAEMWASVANAMKDGDPAHDGPDGRPAITNVLNTEYGTITR